MNIKVHFQLPDHIVNLVRHGFGMFARDMGFNFEESANAASKWVIGTEESSTIRISKLFIENIEQRRFDHAHYFSSEPLIYCDDGRPDYLGTSSYMINCLQEYHSNQLDQFGRFSYSKSYQYKFKCITKNLVHSYFLELYETLPLAQKPVSRKSRILLTHDIDKVFNSLVQDGIWSIKSMRPDLLVKIAYHEFFKSPSRLNISHIMDIEEKRDVRSTFFWIVNRGKGQSNIDNSDYEIAEEPVRSAIEKVGRRGFENGLHKSTFNESFEEEIAKATFPVLFNRYHYLKFNLPNAFNDIEVAGIKADLSLGFADHYGFRNSYGMPFRPFNLEEDRAYDFLEIPLQLMDATFKKYMGLSKNETIDRLIAFIDLHKENNVLSVLWHNSFFSKLKYKGYTEVYLELINYCKSQSLEFTTVEELIAEYL